MRLWEQHKSTVVHDLLAGATGAVAGAPQAMGFALLAGVNPIYGLYAAIFPTIIGALASGSAFMTIAPTNVLMLLVANALAGFGSPNPPLPLFTLTLMVGLFQLLFAVMRLGVLTRFVSNAVIVGFITGAGVLIILGQLDHITGYPVTSHSNALIRFWEWLRQLGRTDGQTLLVGISATLIIYYLHHTRFKSVATLIAIIITSTFVLVFGWTGVLMVRDLSPIPNVLPTPALPNLSFLPSLMSAALATAVLASVQSSALVENLREIEPKPPNIHRDLVAQGLANIVGGLFQGMPVCGSLSRSAVNLSAGARTRLANLLSGVGVALIVLALASLIERVTLAALAGHLIVAALNLIDSKAIRMVWRVNQAGRVAMVTTFVSTLVLPLEYSIYIGVVLHLALYAYTSSKNIHVVRLVPTDDHHFREEPLPTKLPSREPVILSVSGNLFFAAVRQLEEMLPIVGKAEHPVVIFRLRDNEYLGSTGIRALRRYARQLRARGGKLILAGISPHVKTELERTGAIQEFGMENVFYSNDLVFGATEVALHYAREWLASNPDGE